MASSPVHGLLEALAWVLLQFAWPGVLIALVAAIALATFPRLGSRDRYGIAASALALLAVSCLLEMYHAFRVIPSRNWLGVVGLWIAGVALLSGRLIGGWWLLRHRRDAPVADVWAPTVRRLSERLQLAQTVTVVESSRAVAPGLIGSLQPVIVLPSSTLATANAQDVEAILAHELVHVRRGDFSANLFQTAVEALFFFHPATWWLSRRTRIEREQCCDDLAASLFDDPIWYPEALVRLEQQRTLGHLSGIGASAGEFTARVRRLIERRSTHVASERSSWVAVGTFNISVAVMLWAVHGHPSLQLASMFGNALWPMAPSLPSTSMPLMIATLLGLLLGVRHACEPDHLLAVSTLISGERSVVRATGLGISWGVGHTASLFAVGAALALVHLQLPAGVSAVFEFSVSLMLVGLGGRAVYAAWHQGADGPSHQHSHGWLTHQHRGVVDHVHVGSWPLARRPLVVGMVHGLAGSGALTALVMANLPTVSSQIAYILVFGAGATIGMAALSACAGWPLARVVHQRGTVIGLSWVSGVLSMAYGIWAGSPILLHLLSM